MIEEIFETAVKVAAWGIIASGSVIMLTLILIILGLCLIVLESAVKGFWESVLCRTK